MMSDGEWAGMTPDELDRDAVRRMHATLAGRVAGGDRDPYDRNPEPSLVVLVVPYRAAARIRRDRAYWQMLDDLIQFGQAENIAVRLEGGGP